jgi:hypothetical protein
VQTNGYDGLSSRPQRAHGKSMKTVDELVASITNDNGPATLSGPLAALWHDAKGDWHAAHEVVQNESGADAAWVHAYLHRKEPDLPNANYWYQRANRSMPDASLQQEWRDISSALLER